MDNEVRSAFGRTMAEMPRELTAMPIDFWNESVFRFFFCRSLLKSHADVTQLVECDRIDLVLRRGDEAAFVELKFYVRAPRFHAYTGKRLGFKGGPSAQNVLEFERCVSVLRTRASAPGLSKFIVLVYIDPNGEI